MNAVRNRGIDTLRIVAMFFVVIIHVLGKGGILDAGGLSGVGYALTYFLKTVVFCAVNCYAMISGYVMFIEKETSYRYHKFVAMWLQVFVYSFGITVLAYLFRCGDVGIKDVIKSALPVATNQYWFFTSYAGLFFIIPWLNRLFRYLNNKQATCLIVLLFAVFSCYETITGVFIGDWGMNFLWLTIMYCFGAWVKKCNIIAFVRPRMAFLVYLCCCMISWLFKMFSPIKSDIFINYTSPTIVLPALMLLLTFSKWKISDRIWSVVRFLTPAVFGVYIIHMHPFIKEYILQDAFVFMASYPWWLLLIALLGCAVGIFVVCILIEKLRLFLFDWLKINAYIERISKKIENILKNRVHVFLGRYG